LHKTKDSVLFKSIGGSLVLHQPSIRSVPPTMIIHSNSQTFSGRQGTHSNQRPIVSATGPVGLPCMRVAFIRLLCSPHPIQPHRQFARHHHFGHSRMLSTFEPLISAL
jgi:hypothetical protein